MENVTQNADEIRKPRVKLHKFIEGTDDIEAFLNTFEATVNGEEWPADKWTTHLRNVLSGKGMLAFSKMSAADQKEYNTVKKMLLVEYQVKIETYCKRVFNQPFDSRLMDAMVLKVDKSQWQGSSNNNVNGTHLT